MKKRYRSVGICQISPTGLRKIATAIQRKYHTRKNVDLEVYVSEYKGKQTIGVKL